MMMNSSARVMGSAYQEVGSVTAIPTVKMDQMNTTLAHPSLAAPTISSVTTSCVSRQAGSAMVTTTAWTWVMNRIAPRLHFTVHPASGSAPPTSCALIWIKCVMARGTVPMEQMSHPFAVSTLSSLECFKETKENCYDFNINDKWSTMPSYWHILPNFMKTKMTAVWTMEAAVTSASKDHLELSAAVHQAMNFLMTLKPVKISTSAWYQVSAARSATMREEASAATAQRVISLSPMDVPVKL